jgi:hypothetical protein
MLNVSGSMSTNTGTRSFHSNRVDRRVERETTARGTSSPPAGRGTRSRSRARTSPLTTTRVPTFR